MTLECDGLAVRQLLGTGSGREVQSAAIKWQLTASSTCDSRPPKAPLELPPPTPRKRLQARCVMNW